MKWKTDFVFENGGYGAIHPSDRERRTVLRSCALSPFASLLVVEHFQYWLTSDLRKPWTAVLAVTDIQADVMLKPP